MVRALFLFCIFFFLVADAVQAQLRLPALVGDSMVIQRDARVRVWGWAERGEKVQVRFRNKSYTTTTGDDGRWRVFLSPTAAGGPYAMQIRSKSESITVNDILVGDVWLCAGQSNMVHYLDLHRERYQADIDAANYPRIRQFVVPATPVLTGPATDLAGGQWKPAHRQNLGRFSVVAFFFARALYEQYHVPIGIINASVGGTPIEAWTSEAGLKTFPDLTATTLSNKDTAYVNHTNRIAAAAQAQVYKNRPPDAGLQQDPKWYAPDLSLNGWQLINVPGYWEDQGVRNLDGVVWYRRQITVSEALSGKPAKIALGRIVDADEVYVNGIRIGNKTYQYPQRRYDVPAGLLKTAKNTVAVRVTNYAGKGGFVPDKPYYLAVDNDTIDLKGYWHYRVGSVFDDQNVLTQPISLIHQPAALYNGMVAPYTDFPLKGFVWYQGESNTSAPGRYEALLPALIHDWRTQWNQDDLPFLYVQLPNFMETDYSPSESEWAELREAQREALSVPNTAMVTAIDLGEWNDIHPGNKKPIGERLALAARKIAYNERDVVHSGPVYSSATVRGDSVFLSFENVGGGLVSRDGQPLRWFALADADRNFVWANASIAGDQVVLWSEKINHPVYVRYAWADNPGPVNFYNRQGLPASPFEAELENASRLWYGKKAAVVLTYDDALDVHLDHAIPVLDSLGLKATFYLSVDPGARKRIAEWRAVARAGHELGNHTWYHPCDGSRPGRTWVSPDNDLVTYSVDQLVEEIEMTNVFLQSLDGKTERTFAYTCGDMETGEGSFVGAIRDRFLALRGVHGQLNTADNINFDNIYCFGVDENNQDQMISWVEKARSENAMVVILFHGVGGGHSLNVTLEKHRELLSYLATHEKDFWVAPLADAAKHLRQRRAPR